MIKDKKEAYARLVSDVRADYLNGSRELKWCDECKEVNLWAYWQGRGHMDAQIMLVGQDWGCPWDSESAAAVMNNVRDMNDGKNVYYMTGNDNPTDRLLTVLFQSIGFDITKDDPRLFFTNFVLGYRVKGSSGNFKRKWANEDAAYFRRLVDIIRPRILLCLGKDTAKSVLNCFGLPMPKGSYNNVIKSKENPFRVSLPGGSVYIFALAHCGVMGTLNRNRGSGKKTSPDLQIQDWSRIRPIFWSSPQLLNDYWKPAIETLRGIAESDEKVVWCKDFSGYSKNNDVYGIEKWAGKFMDETCRNGLVIDDYQKVIDVLGLDEEKITNAEKDWVGQLSIEGAAACLTYHFRKDHFCEGSLIQNGIANGCVLRLMERMYDLFSEIS